MLHRISMGLVFTLSFTAAVFEAGCSSSTTDDGGSNEGAASVAPAAIARAYEGTIGTSNVMVRVDASGATVTGSYFYTTKTTNGDALVLKGTVSGNKISMTESVNGAGAVTGTWSGLLSATGMSGTWSAGGTHSAFTLTAVKPGDLKLVPRKISDKAEAASPGVGQDCSLDATRLEVFGVADVAAEQKIRDGLKVDPITRNASGKCDGFDLRTVTQTVKFNSNGFLSVDQTVDYEGGAHPEVNVDHLNFVIATGRKLTGKDFFAAASTPKVRDLLIAMINADTALGASDKADMITELDSEWPASMDIDTIQFGIQADGLFLDMTNNYPHVSVALAPAYTLSWASVKPLLKSDSPVLPLAR